MSTVYAVKGDRHDGRHVQNTRDAIVKRRAFQTAGGLSGGKPTGEAGKLRGEYFEAYCNAVEAGGGIYYVVYSYKTPIAWFTDAGWMVVDQWFSTTSTAHRSVVVNALAVAGISYGEVI